MFIFVKYLLTLFSGCRLLRWGARMGSQCWGTRMFRPSPSPAASGRTRSGPTLFEKVGRFPHLISECCAVNVTDHRISWHFFVWLTFDVLWFVINFSDYHKQPSQRHSFPQLITKHSCISTVCDLFNTQTIFGINQGNFFFVIYHKHVNDI